MKNYKCHTCIHAVTKTIKPKHLDQSGQFMCWGCKEPSIRLNFGSNRDFKEGNKCKTYCLKYEAKKV